MENFENWKVVEGYEGLYAVSDKGRVKSLRRNKLMSPAFTKDGYGRVALSVKGEKRYVYVHTLVLEAFVGRRPFEDFVARHLNGNPRDNRAKNLTWGTQKENVADSVRHGTNYQLRKTHCPWGHPLSGVNLWRDGQGNRHCRCCGRARGRINNPNISHVALADELLVGFLQEERELKQLDKELGEL